MPLEPGDRIVSIEEYAAEDLYAEMLNYTYSSNEISRNQTAANFIFSAAYRKLGPSEQTSPYSFSVERGGTVVELEVTLSSDDSFFLGDAPFAEDITGGGIRAGYIAIPTFRYPGDIDLVDRMVNRFIDSDCLIIDLRGNGGGNTVVADYLLGRIIPEEPEKYVMKTKDGTVTNRIGPFPRGEIFTGPVYVLTDFLSFSTANYFAEQIRHARERGLLTDAVLAGETTGGGSAEPVSTALTPDLTFRVSREVVYSPEGNTYETGVVPDIDVAAELTPADLENGVALTGFGGGVDLQHDLTLRKVLEAEGVLP
jgi:C-terminal processing protease CtpA/Prc